jgi:ribosome-associated translation inhibitor RaiA
MIQPQDIQVIGTSSPALRDHAVRSLFSAVDQHVSHVRSIEARFSDENGPRGGVDRRCRVKVMLSPRGEIFVEEDNADPYVAVALAAERVKQSAGRLLHKLRERRG